MTHSNKILISTAVVLLFSATAIPVTAIADDAGAFIGGMLTTRVLGNMRARTQAEQEQAEYAKQNAQQQQAVPKAAPAPAQPTAEQQLDQLNKLAAGGYITPAEYKAKKQAIIDSL
jgi:hypothetical protein